MCVEDGILTLLCTYVIGQLWYVHYIYRDVDVQSTATQPPPPGLSFALVSKVTGGNFPAPDQLEKVGTNKLIL